VNIVVRAGSGIQRFASESGEKILHAGLRAGLPLPYECATGTCGTCKARVVSGRIETAWGDAPGTRYLKAEREVLMCQSLAREDCVLEVGRALGAMLRERARLQTLAGVVRQRRRLTHDVIAFEVALDRPLEFEAGQFVLLSVPDVTGPRAYSMVNFDRRAERLSFVVKKKSGGAVSEWLSGDDVEGTRVGVVGPLGHAVFRPDACKHVLCVAGGSGIAGMMSILSRGCRDGYFNAYDGQLFFGVRGERDVFFLDELKAFHAASHERLRVTVALSDEDVPDRLARRYPALAFRRGLVHAVAAEAMKESLGNVRAYVAGPPPMVDATRRWLLGEARLMPDDIRFDKFS
jgi:toluene monooxygenase electron transfer component